MAWCNSCFCWRDMQRAVVAIGVFSAATSLLQILVTVAVFTGVNQMTQIDFMSGTKESITYQLYVVLAAMDFFLFLFALLVLYGNEVAGDGQVRCYYLPWLVLLPFYTIFEWGTNIFYFYNQFNRLYTTGPLAMGYATGFNLVPLVYWIFKDILHFISFTFIIVHFRRSVVPHLYTGEGTEAVQYIDNEAPYCSGPVLPTPTYNPSSRPVYAPTPAPLPAPLPRPVALPQGAVCSNGNCGPGVRATTQGAPQPLYGYAGPQVSGGGSKPGWTTSIFQSGGR